MEELNELSKLIKEKNCVLFVGSGISIFNPSKLPDSKKLISILLNPMSYFTDNINIVNRLINNINLRPEICFQFIYKYLGNITYEYFKLFKGTKPNLCHYFIAELLRRKYCDFVITTNYDDGLENAISVVENKYKTKIKYKSVITKHEFEQSSITTSIVKLHGCAKREIRSCILNMEEVSFKLSKAKENLLKNISKNKILLFIGYSCNDLDIFPVIESLDCKSIIWITKKGEKISKRNTILEKLFTNQRRDNLISKFNGIKMEYDIKELVEILGRKLRINLEENIKEEYICYKNDDMGTRINKLNSEIKKYLNKYNCSMILGNICEHIGMNKDALKCYKNAKLHSKSQYHIAKRNISRMYSILGKISKAIRGYEEIISSFSDLDKEIVLTYQCLAERLRLSEELPRALFYIEKGITASKNNDWYSELAWCILTKANILSDLKCQKGHIIRLYEESMKYFTKSNNLKGYAQSLKDLGTFYHVKCEYLNATGLYEKAGKYFMDINDKTGSGIALLNLGIIKVEQGELRMARLYLKEAFLIFSELNDKNLMARCSANLSWAFLESRLFNESLLNARTSFSICKKIDFFNLADFVKILEATQYLITNNNSELEKIIKFLDIRMKRKDKITYPQYLLLKAKINIYNGQNENAKKNINDLMKFVNLKVSYVLGKAYFLRAQISFSERNYRDAINLLKCSLKKIGEYNLFLGYIFVCYFIELENTSWLKNYSISKEIKELDALKQKILGNLYRNKLYEEISIANKIVAEKRKNNFLLV